MTYSKYRHLTVSIADRVATLTLNRPEKLNAIDDVLHEDLASIFVDIEKDDSVDVAILTGKGRAFCGGGDLNWLKSIAGDPAAFRKTVREGKQTVYSILDCTKPIIAKVNGHATGLGATIALLCDAVFVADTARIGDPHVSVGLVAGDGGAAIWPQLVGYARAKRYLLTGELLTAAKAEEIGLITQAVPAAELDSIVAAFARRLAKGATRAIQWTKLSINIALRQVVSSVIDASFAYESLSNLTSDHIEGVTAFVERSDAKFTGK